MAGYTDLVIFAHVAQARVGEENFQYALRYILHILYTAGPGRHFPEAEDQRAAETKIVTFVLPSRTILRL